MPYTGGQADRATEFSFGPGFTQPPESAATAASFPASLQLLREKLAAVFERFEFQRVAGRIEEEHCCLFADFALEADIRFDHELYIRGLKSFRKFRPFSPFKDDAEMRDGSVMPIDRVVMGFVIHCGFRFDMRDDLLPE